MNGLVGAITLNAFQSLNPTNPSHVTLFSAVFTLQHSQVYVCTMNCGNEAAYIEPSVDKALGFDTTLCIPNIELHNRHVGL